MAIGFIGLWVYVLAGALCSAKPLHRHPFHSGNHSLLQQQVSVSSTTGEPSYETKYYTQTLDHFNFNPRSYETFQQKYLINSKYWGGAATNAPIFVYTGNEGRIEWFANNTGFMFDIAPKFKALLVFIEHRYYGTSIPFGGDAVVAYKNATTLGYMTSTQALADFAVLITDLKKNLSATDSPVVLFGGSYGGMLASWFRLKYPHIAIGALASSAPILSFENLTSISGFDDTVARDFKGESENCYNVIKGAWKVILETAKQTGGLEKLCKVFGICNNGIDGDTVVSWVASAFSSAAMTDYPTPSNFMKLMPAYPVKEMCKAIDDPKHGADTLAKLSAASKIYYNYTGQATQCFDANDYSLPGEYNGWEWQSCTEMVQPMSGNDMLPASTWDYQNNVGYCRDKYGIVPRPHWMTTEFGGHDFKRFLKRFGSNIIFFNGLRDPWSSGGVLESISKTIVAIVAKEGAHHVDLRFATSDDPKWLRDVRKQEITIIQRWLKQYYHDLAH